MQQPNQMMDVLKTQMMSMLMFKNINQHPQSQGGIELIYVLIVTQLVELIIKYIPIIFQMGYQHYMQKINKTIESKIVNGVTKTIKSSVTITIKMNENDNTIGLSIMDYITNNKNTTRVSYKNKNYILNQTTDIQITPDIYAIMRNSNEHNIDPKSEPNIVQNIELYSYTISIDEIRAFIDDIKERYIISQKNKLGNHKYFFNMIARPAIKTMDGKKDYSRMSPNMAFTMKKFNTNRKFSNLFGEDVSQIKSRVEFFINNKSWYDEKGIPYTLGLLLSGNPGTGKTSTIKCLANETKRHIFNINFNNDITKEQLEKLFFNELVSVEGYMEPVCIPLDQRIYVFEDIDCQNNSESISRTSVDLQTQQVDLSFLLNLLDGILELPGRIIIMTSNHPETLDHALIRPGRIDIVAKYTNCTNETIIAMTEFFYNQSLEKNVKSSLQALPAFVYTPAEVSKILFENFGNMQNAVKSFQCEYIKKSTGSPKLNTEEQTYEAPIFESPYEEPNKKSIFESPYEKPNKKSIFESPYEEPNEEPNEKLLFENPNEKQDFKKPIYTSVCMAFQRGACNRGETCKFNHVVLTTNNDLANVPNFACVTTKPTSGFGNNIESYSFNSDSSFFPFNAN